MATKAVCFFTLQTQSSIIKRDGTSVILHLLGVKCKFRHLLVIKWLCGWPEPHDIKICFKNLIKLRYHLSKTKKKKNRSS